MSGNMTEFAQRDENDEEKSTISVGVETFLNNNDNTKNKSNTIKANIKNAYFIRRNAAEIKHMQSKEDLRMKKLNQFYRKDDNLKKYLDAVCGRSRISLRLLDWLVTNYAKKNNTTYFIDRYDKNNNRKVREYFIVYKNYKEQLKSYNKTLFDPFCRQQRIYYNYQIPKEEYESNFANLHDKSDQIKDPEDNVEEKSVQKSKKKSKDSDFDQKLNDEMMEKLDSDLLNKFERMMIVTTVGQLNFFKWAVEKLIINYAEEHFDEIDADMNGSKNERYNDNNTEYDGEGNKIRKKRTELSTSATKYVCKHDVPIYFIIE